MKNKPRQNARNAPAMMMIISVTLITAAILVRDLYPNFKSYPEYGILGPSRLFLNEKTSAQSATDRNINTQQGTDNRGSDNTDGNTGGNRKDISKDKKQRIAIHIPPQIANLFHVIIRIAPDESVVITRIDVTGYYDFDIIGFDLIRNQLRPEILSEKYVMAMIMTYQSGGFDTWNFVGTINLAFRGVFLIAGSELKLRYNSPKTNYGCIGISLTGGMKPNYVAGIIQSAMV